MRAIQVQEFGGPQVLTPAEVPDPVADPGHVVLSVEAADVIFLDTMLRAGWGGEYFPIEPPYIPGGGGAGRVLSVGEGVDRGWIGRRVVARAKTGYAERIVADAVDLVEVPDGVESREAAAMMHDGVTALGLVQLGRIRRGEWVLVTAAAGGAGSLLVQLARDAGARVIAAARGERKLSLARELGAEIVVDYSEPGWVHTVREAAGGAGTDLTFDGAGGALGSASFDTVAEGGRFVTYGTSDGFTEIDPDDAEQRKVEVITPLEEGPPSQEAVHAALSEALALAARGSIRAAIGATFALDRAADAHASLEARTTIGKSLLIT